MNAVLALYCKHYWGSEGENPQKSGKDGVGTKVSSESQEVRATQQSAVLRCPKLGWLRNHHLKPATIDIAQASACCVVCRLLCLVAPKPP